MYWLSSLPLDSVDPSPEATWIQLQNVTQRNNYSENSEFALPMLKVGTLDSLLSLSDDLSKVNAAVESTVNKLRRQLYDVAEDDEDIAEITVEGVRPEAYLKSWRWDEAKFPSKRPPKDTVAAIMETVQKLDEDLKVKGTEYTQLKQQLQALLRQSQGSLAVRDVSMIVPDGLIVSTENMKTMVSVVPRSSVEDWLRSYETLTEYVVPRSSVLVEEDADHAVFAFVLFRRVEEEFKKEARARGFQVKDVAGTELRSEAGDGEGIDVEEVGIASTRSDSAARIQKLHAEVEKKCDLLRRWCLTSYSECFSSWIHLTSIRLFVESVLRYGLPPQFLAVLIKPNRRYESELRKVLSTTFNTAGGHHYDEEGILPFVHLDLDLEN